MTVRTWRWDGTATALSSIAHGGDTHGTTTYLRRERFLQPDGTFEEVPVVSGNALRGLLRDTAADLYWEALGRPAMPVPVAHALWGGGALVKAKREPLTGSRLADLRAACPVVSVFGAAGGGRIIDGSLHVGKLVPVCAETAHLLPAGLSEAAAPSMWDLAQIERYTRLPGHGPDQASAAAETGDTGTDPDSGLMRYGVETLAAGTRFAAQIVLSNGTSRDKAFLDSVLDRFDRAGARVGGRAAAGHGRIRLDLVQTVLGGPAPEPSDWQAGLDPDKAMALLRLLD